MNPAKQLLGKRILLADDDEVDRQAFARALKAAEIEVELVEVDTADAAIQALRSQSFVCAVLDYQMPGRDGLWVLRTARAENIPVPLIILTGQGDEMTAVELMKAGASDYMPKSALSPGRLNQSLRQVLRLREAEEVSARTASELEEERQRLRMALDAAALGTWDYNPTTQAILWDTRCKEILGLPKESEISQEEYLRRVHPADRALVESIVREVVLPTSSPTFEYEYRFKVDEETYRWCRVTGMTHFKLGAAVRCLGTLQDITDRKAREQDLKKQSEFQQQLIGIVSHDLRSPVQAITMTASVLRAKVTDERQQQGIKRIQASADRIHRIIRDLLDLTQATLGGGISIIPLPSDAGEIVQAVVDEQRAAFPGREIKIGHTGNGEGFWDGERLAQVLSNLVSNAITYSQRNSVISVSSEGRGNELVLRVHNEGEPIPEDLRPHLFEPFSRGRVEERASKSLGLGLFIVNQLVRAHGGRVEVASTREEGTTFTVRLPRASGESAPIEPRC